MHYFFPKKIISLLFFLIIIFSAFKVLAFFSDSSKNTLDFSHTEKSVVLNDNGHFFEISTKAETIKEMLEEKKIKISERDEVFPEKDLKIYPGTKIEIRRAVRIKIIADGKTMDRWALGKTVRSALGENGIILGRLDKTLPILDNPLQNDLKITVTRINIEEVIRKEDIDFKVIAKTDSKLSWREKKIEIKGERGVREIKYRITYKDNKEVSRVVLEKSTAKEPVSQVEVQGTYVKLGKADKGQGTWYAWKGGLYAASRTLPKGSFAKVTNTANGKSVIVEINDYGPQGKGRIIDLDKVAFAKIASIGAGVIGVKVEPVLN